MGACTLLGPEGPDVLFGADRTSGPFLMPAVPAAERVPPVL